MMLAMIKVVVVVMTLGQVLLLCRPSSPGQADLVHGHPVKVPLVLLLLHQQSRHRRLLLAVLAGTALSVAMRPRMPAAAAMRLVMRIRMLRQAMVQVLVLGKL